MGALPAIGGLVVLGVLFSTLSPFFLTERNFANLLNQAATLVMLGMALVFVLLLGEIDLSAGVTGGVEIGREWCRERVCQYVSFSVVAVSLKTKEQNKNR